ncbi:MAG: hypothetical protein HZY76_21575 [Anaerolineae bacterium]|nr:MAG: hypothetical protein HZY76_21575 [Anaerolineae bacterium]
MPTRARGRAETYAPDAVSLACPGRSGAFGQAYRIFVNGQQWGVKCFTRLHADQEARYHAISTYLKKTALPYMVNFDFQAQGIKVKGAWYPILKMEWIEGESLNEYVAQPGPAQYDCPAFRTLGRFGAQPADPWHCPR